jgi:sialate O-acetylesterase
MNMQSLILAALLLVCTHAKGGLKSKFSDTLCHVSNVFGDHMVLQRDRPALVYGFGNPGVLVSVSLNGVSQPAVTVDVNGTWRSPLPAQPATTTPSTLSFSCSDGTIPPSIVDVLFGDVHICSGVSTKLD